ncbi:uncharacterized protein LOC113473927 [Diaphorina citri]|uniref:Uncharacterized protein LOC113473927 n=1 Tax=Diaphorina citri TaxID=121845 RepID=A0A3Q0JLN4_DIACI|nr:uncharacterized protein LOC113473927 [Diaphorina citri]
MEEDDLQEILSFLDTVDQTLINEVSLETVQRVKNENGSDSPVTKKCKYIGTSNGHGNLSIIDDRDNEDVITEFLKLKEIPDLYSWQQKCLEMVQNKNCVLSIPTSGGKTLVGEILIMKELKIKQKSAIFILPYISLVHEKYQSLAKAAEEFKFYLEGVFETEGNPQPLFMATEMLGDDSEQELCSINTNKWWAEDSFGSNGKLPSKGKEPKEFSS